MARQDALLRLHKTLLARRGEILKKLRDDMDSLRNFDDTTGDSADVAFEAGSDEMASHLAELDARELSQIDRALARLKQGTYGSCEGCSEKIPVGRLNALPYTTLCIECQREMEQEDQVSRDLGKELAKVKLEIDAPSRITINERAEIPQTKDETKPLKMAGMAAAGAFLCGLLGICWLEFRSRRVDTAEDVVHGLGMRLVGSLPPPPNRWLELKAPLLPSGRLTVARWGSLPI